MMVKTKLDYFNYLDRKRDMDHLLDEEIVSYLRARFNLTIDESREIKNEYLNKHCVGVNK